MPERRMIQCNTAVDRNSIKREVINGVEHIIVTSWTLPDDIVMNGGLYPRDEVEASFETLEGTLAPVEHPQDEDGNFLPAAMAEAINEYYVGAYNRNVRREGGRICLDKVINVQVAKRTDRGKRLLDRIEAIEAGEDKRPIHTSVGVFLMVEDLAEPKTNAEGLEYTWVARDMVFDHDAILLDSVGAAQPHQGVGMAINSKGDKFQVDRCSPDLRTSAVKAARTLPLAATDRKWDSSAADKRVRAAIGAEDAPNATYARYHLWYDADMADEFGAYKLPFVDIVDGEAMAVPAALRNAAARLSQTQGPDDSEREQIKNIVDNYLGKLKGNMSIFDTLEALTKAAADMVGHKWISPVDIVDNQFIFETDAGFFTVEWLVDTNSGHVKTVGIPIRVEKETTYTPKTNSKKGDPMREMVMNALKEAGIKVNEDWTDEQAIAEYDKMKAEAKANADDGEGDPASANADIAGLTAIVSDLAETVKGLKGDIEANKNADREKMIKTIVNSKKHELTEDQLKTMSDDVLKTLAGNSMDAYGLGFGDPDAGVDDAFVINHEMPN